MNIEASVAAMRDIITHMMRIMPIVLSVFALLAGASVANLSYFFLALGLILVVPIVRAVTNPLFGTLFGAIPAIKESLYKVEAGADCSVLGGKATVPEVMIPSYWWASVVFFGTYILGNAIEMVNVESPATAPAAKVQARKAHAGMAIVIVVILTAAMLIYRWTAGCETVLGAAIGTVLYALLGYWWFALLKTCTNSNMADLFGIASRLMPERDAQQRGSICYPID